MNTRDLLATLDSCKFSKYEPKVHVKEPLPAVNWPERIAMRKELFLWYFKIVLIVAAIDMLFISLPMLLAAPAFGKAVMLGLAPMLLVSISWALPCWVFFDKRALFYAATIGASPVRIGFILAYTFAVVNAMGVSVAPLVMAMMLHWVIFMIPEVMMVVRFSKLPMTAEEENDG